LLCAHTCRINRNGSLSGRAQHVRANTTNILIGAEKTGNDVILKPRSTTYVSEKKQQLKTTVNPIQSEFLSGQKITDNPSFNLKNSVLEITENSSCDFQRLIN